MRGMFAGLVSRLIRHQMCPTVVLSCRAAQTCIGKRSIGGLTGSRVAGFLGRVPVEAIVSERSRYWRPWGFHTDHHTLCLGTWVDSLFSVSDTVQGAIAILEDFEASLRQDWDMGMKATSRSCIVADGSEDCPDDPSRWPLKRRFDVLGHTLQSCGPIRACWTKTKQSLWRAFLVESWGQGCSETPCGRQTSITPARCDTLLGLQVLKVAPTAPNRQGT